MWIGLQLLRECRISAEQLVQAMQQHFDSRKPIGRLANDSRAMSHEQATDVLNRMQGDARPFGPIAVELGYISDQQLSNLLRLQAEEATPVGELLIRMGAVTRHDVDRATPAALRAANREFGEPVVFPA